MPAETRNLPPRELNIHTVPDPVCLDHGARAHGAKKHKLTAHRYMEYGPQPEDSHHTKHKDTRPYPPWSFGSHNSRSIDPACAQSSGTVASGATRRTSHGVPEHMVYKTRHRRHDSLAQAPHTPPHAAYVHCQRRLDSLHSLRGVSKLFTWRGYPGHELEDTLPSSEESETNIAEPRQLKEPRLIFISEPCLLPHGARATINQGASIITRGSPLNIVCGVSNHSIGASPESWTAGSHGSQAPIIHRSPEHQMAVHLANQSRAVTQATRATVEDTYVAAAANNDSNARWSTPTTLDRKKGRSRIRINKGAICISQTRAQ
jgi:hypothetical protein